MFKLIKISIWSGEEIQNDDLIKKWQIKIINAVMSSIEYFLLNSEMLFNCVITIRFSIPWYTRHIFSDDLVNFGDSKGHFEKKNTDVCTRLLKIVMVEVLEKWLWFNAHSTDDYNWDVNRCGIEMQKWYFSIIYNFI